MSSTPETEQQKIDNEKTLRKFEQMNNEEETNEAQQKDDAAKFFNPKTLFESAQTIKTVVDPVLGTVKYGELTFEDLYIFSPLTDKKERIATIAYLMLKKADPTVTIEMIKGLPVKESNALIEIVANQPCFL